MQQNTMNDARPLLTPAFRAALIFELIAIWVSLSMFSLLKNVPESVDLPRKHEGKV